MDDTGRCLSTLTFLPWSSYWHCPLGLSTWIMCLKSNKFYKQTSASALRASLLPKRPHQGESKDRGDSPGSYLPFVCSRSLTDTAKHHSHRFKRSRGFISAPQTHPAFCIAPVTLGAALRSLHWDIGRVQRCCIHPEEWACTLPPPISDCHTTSFFFFFQGGTSDLSEGEWHYSRCDLESALTYKTANLWQTNTFLLTPC